MLKPNIKLFLKIQSKNMEKVEKNKLFCFYHIFIILHAIIL